MVYLFLNKFSVKKRLCQKEENSSRKNSINYSNPNFQIADYQRNNQSYMYKKTKIK